MGTAPAQLFPEFLVDTFGLPGVLGEVVASLIGAALVANIILAFSGIAGPWAKRKITAAFTDRIAVNRIGLRATHYPGGGLQLLAKELIIPEGSTARRGISLRSSCRRRRCSGSVIPMGQIGPLNIHLADPEVGLALVFAFASIASVSLVMAGYASNNKYSLLGGLRAVAQNLAYEIPLIVTAMSVVVFAGTLQISGVVGAQTETLVTIAGFDIPAWFAFVNPFAFVLFLTANMAEIGRNPFDIPEAPTEIVGGYQTEYSSAYFVLFYLGEFVHIFLGGAILSVVFLGGASGPARRASASSGSW